LVTKGAKIHEGLKEAWTTGLEMLKIRRFVRDDNPGRRIELTGVQVSDTTGDDSSNEAGPTKNLLLLVYISILHYKNYFTKNF